VGSTADSRRAPEVRARRLSGDVREVHGPPTHTAITVVAHVPDNHRQQIAAGRLLRRADSDVPAPVCACDPGGRAPSCRACRGHRPTHGGVDGATTPRSVPWNEAPRYLLHDRVSAFYGWTTTAAAIGIQEILTAPQSPWQNAYAERLIGSIRRECLDHIIITSERGLRRVLDEYVAYYLKSRTHLALNKDAPVSRLVATPAGGEIAGIPYLSGLHHRYERRAA